MEAEQLTIGQLAKRVGVRTSTLRFYEDEGLLMPSGRTNAGYRLYPPEAIHRIEMIHRAQQLGFSLSDIRPLLNGWDASDLSDQTILEIAENRYLALEKQVTEKLVLQHELELFLQDLNRRKKAGSPDNAFDKLLERVCADPTQKSSAHFMLNWLMEQAHCNLTTESGRNILNRLQGQHVHVWQEGDAYNILFVSNDPQVENALRELADLESNCDTHANTDSRFNHDDEGYLFTAKGEFAFIFARLFLVLGK
ncbi:MAG TPA: MerR family transcriptional regulator [Anaerolineales bacterium]|nr:MerR family transcriptional regulator [Anaerolineales bacterium]